MRATKKYSLRTAPNILVVHLKRFDFSYAGKLSHYVAYPETLSLKTFIPDSTVASMANGAVNGKSPAASIAHLANGDLLSSNNNEKSLRNVSYKLYGVLVHLGHTSHSGHYYSYVRAPNDSWNKADDQRVSGVQAQEALNQNAYILFYSRIVNNPESNNSSPLKQTVNDSSFKQPYEMPPPPRIIRDETSIVPHMPPKVSSYLNSLNRPVIPVSVSGLTNLNTNHQKIVIKFKKIDSASTTTTTTTTSIPPKLMRVGLQAEQIEKVNEKKKSGKVKKLKRLIEKLSKKVSLSKRKVDEEEIQKRLAMKLRFKKKKLKRLLKKRREKKNKKSSENELQENNAIIELNDSNSKVSHINVNKRKHDENQDLDNSQTSSSSFSSTDSNSKKKNKHKKKKNSGQLSNSLSLIQQYDSSSASNSPKLAERRSPTPSVSSLSSLSSATASTSSNTNLTTVSAKKEVSNSSFYSYNASSKLPTTVVARLG